MSKDLLRIFLFIIIFTTVFCPSSYGGGQEDFYSLEGVEAGKADPVETANSIAQSLTPGLATPDWIKRTTLQVRFLEDYKPSYIIESIQPIHSFTPGVDALFTQIGARTRGGSQTFNTGIGYRTIVASAFIVGVNAFYDYTTYNGHQRTGAGIEILGVDFEGRANSYLRASGPKETGTNVVERVMTGFDLEAGGHLFPWPALDSLRVYAGYQRFNAEYGDDFENHSIRLAYPISKYVEIEAKVLKEKSADEKFYVQVSAGPGIGGSRRSSENDQAALRKKLLQPVERENDILIEQRSGSAGTLTIKIKRGV